MFRLNHEEDLKKFTTHNLFRIRSEVKVFKMAYHRHTSRAERSEMARQVMWIREQQQARAYAFPPAFAPDGRLRETEPNRYMQLLRLHYGYRASLEDLTLELRTEDEDGEVSERLKVGEVFSVDLQWTEVEAIRVHLIAMRPNTDRVAEHYQVYDLGVSGVAVTIPRQAWDNWRQWGHSVVEGVPVDQRLLFLALGDRHQIGNMNIEEFTRMTCDQVEALMDRFVPGLMLVRPSLFEAGLVEGPVKPPTPPIVDLSRDSSNSGDEDSQNPGLRRPYMQPRGSGRGSFARGNFSIGTLPGPRGRGAGYQHLSQRMTQIVTPGSVKGRGPRSRNEGLDVPKVPQSPVDVIHLGPDGKPLPKKIVENMERLFLECVHGGSFPNTPETVEAQGGESSKSLLEEMTVEEAIENDFSIDSRDTSICNISGVTSFQESTSGSSLSEWEGPGVIPLDDSIEIFFADKVNASAIYDVSTDSSVLEVKGGQTNVITPMDV